MTSDYLSPEGRRRKAEMAELLTQAVVRRRRTREALRVGALVAILALGLWLLRPPAIERATPERDVAARFERLDFEVATGNRETIASWIVAPSDTSRFKIDDAELMDMLAQAGHPSGILRVGERVVLTEPLASSGD